VPSPSIASSDSQSSLLGSRTKIVATVGPACRDRDTLKALVSAGVNVFRLNFSHGTHEDHSRALEAIDAVEAELGRPLGVLQDLGGPKIRLGALPSDELDCPVNARFALVAVPSESATEPQELTCTYPDLADDLRPGETILFADGAVAMVVETVTPGRAELRVTLPGKLRSRQGINLPGTELKIESLTPKDIADLEWTARYKDRIQFVGLSFVRSAADIDRLRGELERRNIHAAIVAKIEKPQAVRNLKTIIGATDAVMVARGDLGVEMETAQVPAIQKRIIAECNRASVPVITATQMLTSMESSNRPTRAEATDVFNAVLDGTDAVMLSGESAIGRYPVEAVATMRRICDEAEATRAQGIDGVEIAGRARFGVTILPTITTALVEAAVLVAQRINAAMILVATASGVTARALSRLRPTSPVLALATTPAVARSLTLSWGVVPVTLADTPLVTKTEEADLQFALDHLKREGLARSGQKIVLIRGYLPNDADLADQSLLIREIP